MDTFFIIGAKYAVFLLPLIVIIYYFATDASIRRRLLWIGAPSLVLSYAVAKAVSHFYYNPRPFVVEHFAPLIAHVADNGFPSDHVLLAAAFAAIATYAHRRFGFYLWIIVAWVAVSRVYVGVHHPADVVGSMLIALLSTHIVYVALRRYKSAILVR